MDHIITKFGGTSVSSRKNWDNIVAITKQHINNNIQPVIVCSALTQISNQLEQAIEAALLDQHYLIEQAIVQLHRDFASSLAVSVDVINEELQLLKQLLTGIALLRVAPAKIKAQVMSLGELMMTRLGHIFLHNMGIKSYWLDVRTAISALPIPNADDAINYLAACCDSAYNPKLRQRLQDTGAEAIITQGFFATNLQGETVLLGRGGSDTSAALLAAVLKAKMCEIWTDVPGIYTANPHQIPQARLLKHLNYDEAQEIASMGAKVLHPNCLAPVKLANIPMLVKYTPNPEHSGTKITQDSDVTAPLIKSIQVKHSITLISIDTLNMWQQVGFLADVFQAFKDYQFSVDLLSSSEFNVTVSLDSKSKLYEKNKLDLLLGALKQFGRVKLIEPCSAVSLVGHHIRTTLPQLGDIFEVFEDKQIHLLSLASNDLNLTFVVDESHAEKLCQKLHQVLIENNPQNFYYSKSWYEEFGVNSTREPPWWEREREQLLSLGAAHSPCYVYHQSTIIARIRELSQMRSIDKLFYAMKANSNSDVLRIFYDHGIGFECVSINELYRVKDLFPNIEPQRLLFTPNFAARIEYEAAAAINCYLTIDNLYLLEKWPEIFKNKKLLLRIDPGSGAGHHKFVSTAGNESKFGIPRQQLEQTAILCARLNITIIGLHAHSGSGILTIDLWESTALLLTDLLELFPSVRCINLGGGLGVADKPGQQNLDLAKLDLILSAIKSSFPTLTFWMEPGRYFVSDAGVILAKVTQCKIKGKVRFVGLETGMNSLVRPALYGAYHEIVNLTKFEQEKIIFAHIVGPICESADTLGYDRLLPDTQENDILLIANAGSYGYCMSSNYNLRPPAKEIMLN